MFGTLDLTCRVLLGETTVFSSLVEHEGGVTRVRAEEGGKGRAREAGRGEGERES